MPTLSRGDVVIRDNLGSHKGQAARRLIRAAAAKRFLRPRYWADLNPIEPVLSRLKTLLRAGAGIDLAFLGKIVRLLKTA